MELWCWQQYLIPHMSTLIHYPLGMFLQSCLRWRDEQHIVLLCEEFPPGLVNVCAFVGLIIQHDHELSCSSTQPSYVANFALLYFCCLFRPRTLIVTFSSEVISPS